MLITLKRKKEKELNNPSPYPKVQLKEKTGKKNVFILHFYEFNCPINTFHIHIMLIETKKVLGKRLVLHVRSLEVAPPS